MSETFQKPYFCGDTPVDVDRGGNYSYKPQKGAVNIDKLPKKNTRPLRAVRIDCKDAEVISSETESEGTVRGDGLDSQEIKTEIDSSDILSTLDGSEQLWTPQILLIKQYNCPNKLLG